MELSQPHAGPLARPRAARLAVAAIFFVNGAVFANWIARIPDVKARLQLSDSALGLALLCMALGALLAQTGVGWLVGRFGSRSVTALSALAFCAAMVLPGVAYSLPLLMLALLVLGACNGGLDVAMNAQGSLVEQAYERPILTSFHGLWSVGGLVGAAIGGLLAQGMSLELHFLVVAITGFVGMALAGRWLLADAGTGHAEGPHFALPPRSLLPLGAIAFCVLVCEGAIADWSAVYMREGLGSSSGVAASGYAVFALCMAVGRLTGDWLTERVGVLVMVRGGGLLVLAGIGVALIAGTPLSAIIGFGMVGAGLACTFPLLLSAAARTPGVATGTAIAAVATAGYTGFLIGPPLIGTSAALLSLRGALGVLGLFGACVLLLSGAVRRPPAEQQ